VFTDSLHAILRMCIYIRQTENYTLNIYFSGLSRCWLVFRKMELGEGGSKGNKRRKTVAISIRGFHRGDYVDLYLIWDRLCGLVVRVPAYRSRGPASILSSGSGTGSTQPREDNLGAIWRKLRLRSRKPKLTAAGIRCADHVTAKVGPNFADKRRSLGRYSSLVDSSHGVCLYLIWQRSVFLSKARQPTLFRRNVRISLSSSSSVCSCQFILFDIGNGGDIFLCLFTFTRLHGFNSHKI
jgi:hypothetical protein